MFKEELPGKAKVINQQSIAVSKASQVLCNSHTFRYFLKHILDIGNRMNSGTLKG